MGAKNFKPAEYLALVGDSCRGIEFVANSLASGAVDHVVPSGQKGAPFAAGDPDEVQTLLRSAILGCLTAAAELLPGVCDAPDVSTQKTITQLTEWVIDSAAQPATPA